MPRNCNEKANAQNWTGSRVQVLVLTRVATNFGGAAAGPWRCLGSEAALPSPPGTPSHSVALLRRPHHRQAMQSSTEHILGALKTVESETPRQCYANLNCIYKMVLTKLVLRTCALKPYCSKIVLSKVMLQTSHNQAYTL